MVYIVELAINHRDRLSRNEKMKVVDKNHSLLIEKGRVWRILFVKNELRIFRHFIHAELILKLSIHENQVK